MKVDQQQLIFHIGLDKTSITFLQEEIFPMLGWNHLKLALDFHDFFLDANYRYVGGKYCKDRTLALSIIDIKLL